MKFRELINLMETLATIDIDTPDIMQNNGDDGKNRFLHLTYRTEGTPGVKNIKNGRTVTTYRIGDPNLIDNPEINVFKTIAGKYGVEAGEEDLGGTHSCIFEFEADPLGISKALNVMQLCAKYFKNEFDYNVEVEAGDDVTPDSPNWEGYRVIQAMHFKPSIPEEEYKTRLMILEEHTADD